MTTAAVPKTIITDDGFAVQNPMVTLLPSGSYLVSDETGQSYVTSTLSVPATDVTTPVNSVVTTPVTPIVTKPSTPITTISDEDLLASELTNLGTQGTTTVTPATPTYIYDVASGSFVQAEATTTKQTTQPTMIYDVASGSYVPAPASVTATEDTTTTATMTTTSSFFSSNWMYIVGGIVAIIIIIKIIKI